MNLNVSIDPCNETEPYTYIS